MKNLRATLKKQDPLRPKTLRTHKTALFVGTIGISVLSLALPILTLQVYDRILPNPGSGTLAVLITGVCIALMMEAVLRLCRSYLIGRIGATYEHRLSCGAMRKVLNADLSRLGSYGIGEHMHRMGAIGKLKDFYNGHSFIVQTELLFVPIFFALIAYIARDLVWVPFTVLSVFIFISLWKGRNLRLALAAREQADDTRFNFLIESLEGVHTLKSFALEQYFDRRYETLEEQSGQENYKVAQATASVSNTGAVFSHIMVAGVISVGAWFVLNGMLTTGGLIATLLLSGRIMQPTQKALALWTRYQDYVLARRHVLSLFETPQEEIFDRPVGKDNEIVPRPTSDGALVMEGVSFGYDEGAHDHHLFRDINLSTKRGDAILISGAHGCGKTTLLNCIAGLARPSQGTITLDGYPLNTYKPQELSAHIGYVRATPMIFRGTIRDNLTCFGMTENAKVQEVARLLEVDKDVALLPGGFDTILQGTSSDTVTMALKQRIALVRALAPKPRLILFDNADRMLDKESYAMVYSFLAKLKGKATMIIVSDDENIRGLADSHYMIENKQFQKSNVVIQDNKVRPYGVLQL